MLSHISPSSAILAGSFALVFVLARYLSAKSSLRLKGPPGTSFLFGLNQYINRSPDPGSLFEGWMLEYGSVFQLPPVLGTKQIVICDPKAIAHLFARDTYEYVQLPAFKYFIEILIGKGLLWADGDSHKRQRKALSPAFSVTTVRQLTPILFDCAYTLKYAWDEILVSSNSGEAIIEVQQWMNYLTLDTIGIAGFGHDFGALRGHKSSVLSSLEAFSNQQPSGVPLFLHFLIYYLPIIHHLPMARNANMVRLSESLEKIFEELLSKKKAESEGSTLGSQGDISAIGALVNIDLDATNLTTRMSQEEILAQMKVILVAGYDPPAMIMTWTLIEISRHLDVQRRLREELLQHGDVDPSWDQMMNPTSFPLLEAVICEVLRLHPSLVEIPRMVKEDNILPVGTPFQNSDGHMSDRLALSKGTWITVPLHCLNQSKEFWGLDAKDFVPDRWLNSSVSERRSKEIQGYKHLLSFGDGPRTCIGKAMTLASFRVALSVLVRKFTFELPNGPGTKISSHWCMLPRPKVEGQSGAKVPLRVRRVEG